MILKRPRIALIHALAHSFAPIIATMARNWPDASRMNLLDDSLSADLAAGGRGPNTAMQKRIERLAQYALDRGSDVAHAVRPHRGHALFAWTTAIVNWHHIKMFVNVVQPPNRVVKGVSAARKCHHKCLLFKRHRDSHCRRHIRELFRSLSTA